MRAAMLAGAHTFRVVGDLRGVGPQVSDEGLFEYEAVACGGPGGAWSVYFSDPAGHRLEVTTYDVEPVRTARGAGQPWSD